MGAGGGRDAAIDERIMEGRLVFAGEDGEDGEDPVRGVGRDLVSQLRQAGRIRKTSTVAEAVRPAADLHGIHGARKRKHVRGDVADREEVSRGSNQLGTGGGENADLPAVGFLEEAVRGPAAGGVVPRGVPDGWRAVPEGRGGVHQENHSRRVEPGGANLYKT